MLATGYVHAERQQWHEAAELMLQAVRRLPAVRGGLMVDIARVQRMSGGVDLYDRTVATRRVRLIAMSVLASGAIPAEEAIQWICERPRIESIVFGASSRGNILQTKQLIEKYSSGA